VFAAFLLTSQLVCVATRLLVSSRGLRRSAALPSILQDSHTLSILRGALRRLEEALSNDDTEFFNSMFRGSFGELLGASVGESD